MISQVVRDLAAKVGSGLEAIVWCRDIWKGRPSERVGRTAWVYKTNEILSRTSDNALHLALKPERIEDEHRILKHPPLSCRITGYKKEPPAKLAGGSKRIRFVLFFRDA